MQIANSIMILCHSIDFLHARNVVSRELFSAVHVLRSAVLPVCRQRQFQQQPVRHRMLPARQNVGHVQPVYTM